MANALTDYWLTLQNQGNNLGTGEGDYGPGTDWLRMIQGTGSPLWEEAQRYGYSGSMPAGMSGDTSDYQAGNPQQELFDWMKSSGYNYGIKPTMNGGQWNAWLDPQGQEIPGTLREFEAPDDSTFWKAALAAGALAGGAAGGYFGGGSGLTGTTIPLAETAAWPAGLEGASFLPAGGSASGIGTMGAIAPGAGALAPIGATGAGTLGTNAIMGGLGELASVGGAIGGFGGLGGGSAGAGSWNGTNFTGGNSLLSSLGSANSLANLAQAGLGLYGQHKAIGAMKDSTNQSNAFNQYAFDTIRADNKPLLDLRNSVLPQLQGLLSNPGSITGDPGYQFQLGEGTKALNNSAAARGMTYSGAQGKALQRYGQDYAGTKLDQSLNRLTNVAGLGQVGANSNNAATQNYANNQSSNALNMGQARGSVYGSMANIGGNALSDIYNPWQYDQLNRRGTE